MISFGHLSIYENEKRVSNKKNHWTFRNQSEETQRFIFTHMNLSQWCLGSGPPGIYRFDDI